MDNRKELNSVHSWGVVAVVAVLFVVLVVLLLLFLLRGESVINNNSYSVETTQSITCEKKGTNYPFLINVIGDGSTKINAVFNNGKLDLISLVYRAPYGKNMGSEQSETESRIAMNESLRKDNMSVEDLGVVFSALDDVMQLSLQVDANDINGVTAKYFLLDGLNDTYSQDNVMKHYLNEGFSCLAEK